MGHTECKSTNSKSRGGRRERKLGKRIAHKKRHARKEQPKHRNTQCSGRRNYSPEYNPAPQFTPLFYSGGYKPSLAEDTANENYDCFVGAEVARRLQAQLQAEDEVLRGLAHFNI